MAEGLSRFSYNFKKMGEAIEAAAGGGLNFGRAMGLINRWGMVPPHYKSKLKKFLGPKKSVVTFFWGFTSPPTTPYTADAC